MFVPVGRVPVSILHTKGRRQGLLALLLLTLLVTLEGGGSLTQPNRRVQLPPPAGTLGRGFHQLQLLLLLGRRLRRLHGSTAARLAASGRCSC